jgi:hypothetical protein
MAHEADVGRLERAGWDALSTSGAAAATFYDRVLADDVRVVACRGTARRGDDVYRAHFTSTYLRVGSDWRLAVHQQTPV